MFADGAKLIRARHPNHDPGEGFFGGYARDATDPARLTRYVDPTGMFVHGLHGLGWGSLHFQIRQKSAEGRYTFEAGKGPRVAGGWQNKSRALIAEAPFDPEKRFVENVFEELDAPREWFLDRATGTLHFIPPAERLDFANFPTDRFGVVSLSLKTRTQTWVGLGQAFGSTAESAAVAPLHHWLGAILRDLVNRGRESTIVSNMELSDHRGILIKVITPGSPAALAKLPADAIIVAANDVAVGDVSVLTSLVREAKGGRIHLKILTASAYVEIAVAPGSELPQPETEATASPGKKKIRTRSK